MRRALLLVALLAFVACGNKKTPEPTVSATPAVTITAADLGGTVLTAADLGAGWKAQPGAKPDTFQVGGKVGSATYVAQADAEQTVSFVQQNGSGFLSNTVYSLADEDQAKAVMSAQNDADETATWRQEREDGGSNDVKKLGDVANLDSLGDEMYAGRFEVNVKLKGATTPTKRVVEYVAYRIGRVMSFVVAQDAGVATFAKRQEARLARLSQ